MKRILITISVYYVYSNVTRVTRLTRENLVTRHAMKINLIKFY